MHALINIALLTAACLLWASMLLAAAHLIGRPRRRRITVPPVVDRDLPLRIPESVMVSRRGRIIELGPDHDGRWSVATWTEHVSGWYAERQELPSEPAGWEALNRIDRREL